MKKSNKILTIVKEMPSKTIVAEKKAGREANKKRIQALQSLVKKISPNISLRNDLKAPQWNSKNAETIYTEYIARNAPSIDSTKKVTRSTIYKEAKKLGWSNSWNKSTMTQMLEHINDGGLNGTDWQNAFKRIFERKIPFTERQIELIKNKTINSGKKYFLIYKLKNSDTEHMLPLNNLNNNHIQKIFTEYFTVSSLDPGTLEGGIWTNRGESTGSDKVDDIVHEKVGEMKIEEIASKTKKRVKKAGSGWANYHNKSSICLKKYQIYTPDNDDCEYETCILHTLSQAGISKAVINQIKSIFGQEQVYDIMFRHLPQICDLIERQIRIHKYRNDIPNKLQSPIVYGKKYNEIIDIAVYRDHAFTYEPTVYTTCYIKNYEELQECKDERKTSTTKVINGKPYYYNKPSYLSSLALVKLLDSLGHFTAYRSTKPSQSIVKPEASLDICDKEQRPFSRGTAAQREKQIVILAADFETEVCNGVHKGILFSCKEINDRTPAKIVRPNTSDDDWEKQFMYQVSNLIASIIKKYDPKKTEIQMYFHNLKYDFSIFQKYFYKSGIVESGGSLYESTICIHSYEKLYKVKCRDSLKFFNCKLNKLPSMFNLPVQKEEAIAYEYYTHINIQSDDDIPKSEYEKYLPDDESIQKFYHITRKVKKFNPVKYYMSYLRADVEVLALALLSFGNIIEELTGIKLGEKMTISSVGHQNAANRGCYDGCYETFGNLRMFIQQGVKGGRNFANPKHKMKVIKGPTENFDAVSQYPSAMCRMKGCPMGPIKKGDENTFDYYETKDYYIVKIKISKINQKRDVPMVSVKDNDGIIEYINEVPEEGLITTVDMITLQDYIKYAQIDYEIIEGVYWDGGFNTKIGETMLELHNERNKYKQTNKPKADMIKLLMNSTYGKTIQKLNDKRVTFHKKQGQENYIHENFGQILEIEDCGSNQIKITKRDYDLSYSLNYVGVYILSTSKRIMNEVFDCMEAVGSPMYYTDTDSIHLPQKDIPDIAKIYKVRYGKELIGKNLGQFHTDFSMDGCRNVYSTKSIFLGSKVYIDVLQGIDEVTGKIKSDVHMRMKSINSAGIEYEINKISSDPSKRLETAFSVYEKLCDPTYSKEFCLNPTKSNVSFEHTKSGIITRETGSFTRVVSFGKNNNKFKNVE
jgi:hypothetical protein